MSSRIGTTARLFLSPQDPRSTSQCALSLPWQLLAGQTDCGWSIATLQGHLPGIRCLIGVTRAYNPEIGNSPHRHEVLDRLVGRPIFSQVDGIMCIDIDNRLMHYCGKANTGTHVVMEDKEGRTVRQQPTVKRESIADSCHRVLSDTEIYVSA